MPRKHHGKLSRSEKRAIKRNKWLARQQKKHPHIEDSVQDAPSYWQTISDITETALTSFIKTMREAPHLIGRAANTHPLLTTAGISLLTIAVVEALSAYSVGSLPPDISSECKKTDISFDFFDVPQCKTYGVYALANATKIYMGQLFDQLTGSRQLFDGSADCLLSNCKPDTAMSEVYGECIQDTMKAVLESVLKTAERLGEAVFDEHPAAQACVANMPDWRIAHTNDGKTTYDVLVSAVQVIAPKLLPDICTRFQVAMIGKENECKDTNALFVENLKQKGIIVGIVIGSIVGAAVLGVGAYVGYQKCKEADCSLPTCSNPCGEEGAIRRGFSHAREGLERCLRACTAPFISCYEWCTGKGRNQAATEHEMPMATVTNREQDAVIIEPAAPPIYMDYGRDEVPPPAYSVTNPDRPHSPTFKSSYA